MARRVANWIEGFVEYASAYTTPDRYKRWAAIWTLSVAAKRSIAMKSRGNLLCPNLFVQLIGGPSTGKSQAVNAIKSVLSPASKFRFIPPSVTRAGLEDFMKDNLQQRTDPSGRAMFSNECIGLSEEMQGILPDQDLGHLTLYNILFDLPKTHTAVTRTHGEVRLEQPYCGIFTGAQPAFLAATLPEQAWGMGFMSRSIMVWGTPPPRRSMFDTQEVDFKLQEDLIADLKDVFNLHGFFTWSKTAKDLYDTWWVEKGGQPVPQHKRLAVGYNGRRELHMVKLAMIHSLAESSSLIVEQRHVAQAISDLLEVEKQMQHIFNEMAKVGSVAALEDVYDRIRADTTNGSTTAESTLIEMLMARFPSSQVHSIIENLLAAGHIRAVKGDTTRGNRRFQWGGG